MSLPSTVSPKTGGDLGQVAQTLSGDVVVFFWGGGSRYKRNWAMAPFFCMDRLRVQGTIHPRSGTPANSPRAFLPRLRSFCEPNATDDPGFPVSRSVQPRDRWGNPVASAGQEHLHPGLERSHRSGVGKAVLCEQVVRTRFRLAIGTRLARDSRLRLARDSRLATSQANQDPKKVATAVNPRKGFRASLAPKMRRAPNQTQTKWVCFNIEQLGKGPPPAPPNV